MCHPPPTLRSTSRFQAEKAGAEPISITVIVVIVRNSRRMGVAAMVMGVTRFWWGAGGCHEPAVLRATYVEICGVYGGRPIFVVNRAAMHRPLNRGLAANGDVRHSFHPQPHTYAATYLSQNLRRPRAICPSFQSPCEN